MKKLLLLSAVFLCTAFSSFATHYITVAYYGDGMRGCWPEGGGCLHIVTIVFNGVQKLDNEFNNAGIVVPQGATMGLITQGAQKGDYQYFDDLNVPITSTDDPNALTNLHVPPQNAVWSATLGGYLVYFEQN
jgi:hypothetical protein